MRKLRIEVVVACCSGLVISLALVGPSTARARAAQGRPSGAAAVYEGESLAISGKVQVSGGKVVPQPMNSFGRGWSGDAQLLWTGGQPGAVLDLILDVPARAVYAVELHMTRAPDFGQLRIQVDGKDVAATFDGYGPTVVPSGPFPVGSFELGPGPRKVSLMITGRNRNSTGFLAGIDYIRLTRAGQASVSGAPSIVAAPPGPPNLARLGIRTTLEIWNGVSTVDHTARIYATDALTESNRKSWLWSFRWSTSVPGAKSAVLVATTEARFAADSPLAPSGLLGQKQVPDGVPPAGVTREFSLDVASWVLPAPQAMTSRSGAQRIYMRIVLLDGNGQPLGPPSAAVSLMRGRPQRPATEIFASVEKLKAEEAAMKAKASVFEVKILAHKPVTFPIDSKWGCVKVLKNPFYGNLNHPLVAFKPGESTGRVLSCEGPAVL